MATNSKRHLVFGYGTLKAGQPNHNLWSDKESGDAVFVANARTDEKWPLVIATDLNIPFLLNIKGLGHNVIGVIYEVDQKKLDYLDAFEGYPKFYDRILIPLTTFDGRKLSAYAYFFRDHKPEMEQLPFHEDYDSYGPHGLPYVERQQARSAREEAAYVISKLRKTQDKHLLFVYGTLKSNQPNYSKICPGNTTSTFVGSGSTQTKYPLVIGSKYNIPFLLNNPGLGHNISGEVYEVDNEMLAFLDEFEGYPELYDKIVEPINMDDGTVKEAWLYVFKEQNSKFLELPFISNYDSFGSHGRPYVVSEDCTCVEDLELEN